MRRYALIVLAILFIFLISCAIFASRSRVLTVAFLDVGQGTAIFVRSPLGHTMLIDGGPDATILERLGSYISFYDRHIDLVIATSANTGDVGGLPFVLDRFSVGGFVDSGIDPDTAAYHAITEKISEDNAHTIVAEPGMDIDFGDGTHFLIDSSGAEISGTIRYGRTSISIPADEPNMASSTSDKVFVSDGVTIGEK